MNAPAVTRDKAHSLSAWLLEGGGSNCGARGARFDSPYVECLSCLYLLKIRVKIAVHQHRGSFALLLHNESVV